jgi:hypothetical protein
VIEKHAPRISWLVCGVVLVLVITGARPFAQELLLKQSRAASTADALQERYPQLTPIAAGSRPCGLEDFGDFRLVCPRDTRPLAALPHPAGFEIPVGIFASDAREFALAFGQRTLNCREIPARNAREDGSGAESTFLLIYVPDAISAAQHAWIVDRDASCGRVVELARGSRTGGRNGFGYLLNDQTAAVQGRRIVWLAEFLPPRSASGQEQRAEP